MTDANDNSKFDAALAEWFRALPTGAIVEWTGDGGTALPGVYTTWVDIVIADACAALGVNWLITISAPGNEHIDHGDTAVEPDLTAWFVIGPGDLDEAAIALPAGEPPSPEQLAALEAVAAEDSRRSVVTYAAWSVDALSRALSGWIAIHAGRIDLDVQHTDDPDTPMMRRLQAALAEERYDFAPGIVISESAFESLLGLDPDAAAHLSAAIVDQFGPLVPRPEDN